MRTISLEPKKSQAISIELASQQCLIRLVQRESFIYMDLTLNGVAILQGVPCLYGNKMIRYKYLGFAGDLVFLDSQGEEDPHYDGLGGRFQLFYMEESDFG
ncbi:phage baseplate plug family protein [Yokenella regensburgei]|uniref:phage baseplate plug family protein n=1 Tax=Yokenella regensburgei TaxID=158877 RepID=UPI003EDA5C2C